MERVITITFTPTEIANMSMPEWGGVRYSIEALAHSDLFTNVEVVEDADRTRHINATPISDSEVWRRRCEEARAELADLRGKVIETYNEIVKIIRGEMPLDEPDYDEAGGYQ